MNLREERGRQICKTDSVRRIDEHEYRIKSQSGNGEYQVLNGEFGWLCSCPDAIYRDVKCKHIWAVELSLAIRNEVESSTTVIQEVKALLCKRCSSERIVKKALRHNDYGDIQRYLCKDCGYRFSFNIGFERMKASPQAITQAMQLYFTGESLRNVQKFLRLQGVSVSHVAVLKWIRKYVGLMDKYLDRITPKVSDKWRADELYVKFKGNKKYLFAVMDDETRFWIAQEVAHWKEDHDTKKLFQMAREKAEKVPKTLITDGLKSYHSAYLSEFAPQGTEHIQEIQIDGEVHNNKMERMNGEVRDREKVMRGLKNMDTPILKGYQIFHNYIRAHEGLGGDTPAQRAGITVEGVNKWLTIIQNASKSKE